MSQGLDYSATQTKTLSTTILIAPSQKVVADNFYNKIFRHQSQKNPPNSVLRMIWRKFMNCGLSLKNCSLKGSVCERCLNLRRMIHSGTSVLLSDMFGVNFYRSKCPLRKTKTPSSFRTPQFHFLRLRSDLPGTCLDPIRLSFNVYLRFAVPRLFFFPIPLQYG